MTRRNITLVWNAYIVADPRTDPPIAAGEREMLLRERIDGATGS
jgi:hypothetical protein